MDDLDRRARGAWEIYSRLPVPELMPDYSAALVDHFLDGYKAGAIAERALSVAAMRFAGKILAAHREHGGCDVDGGDIQEWATECGLLAARTVTEPCGEVCACAEDVGFPTECYFPTEAGLAALMAHRAKEGG